MRHQHFAALACRPREVPDACGPFPQASPLRPHQRQASRREIQESGESDRGLAARVGLNPKTVAKWRRRTTTEDARKGPKQPVPTVLIAVEEALVVVFRKHTRLPLNACLAHLKPTIPTLR